MSSTVNISIRKIFLYSTSVSLGSQNAEILPFRSYLPLYTGILFSTTPILLNMGKSPCFYVIILISIIWQSHFSGGPLLKK